jgi:deoxyribodipyrimidine photo-lyase
MKGLFVFRRDLRVEDNTGLIELLSKCDTVYCIFILDDRQIGKKNTYLSYNSLLFMLQTLVELKKTIPLSILHGDPAKVIENVVKANKIDVVSYNRDYTPFSVKRDKSIESISTVESYHDLCLNSPEDIKPYKVYTPYYTVASKKKVRLPKNIKLDKIAMLKNVKNIDMKKLISSVEKKTSDGIQIGGRTEGLKTMKEFVNNRMSVYVKSRDDLTKETSRLSPYIKFGVLSIREVYHACSNAIFRKELYWRDFYMQIGYHFPQVFGNNFRGKVKWATSKKLFDAWCNGETGYDIVDACMNQLNKSGYMHNRGRMIVASFLTKILHIDWRLGERYFATKLTDYDPCSNNGGWQWSAGTGSDAQPYFRIFNPFTQAKKFDKNGEYRTKWLGDGWQKKYENMEKIADYEVERKRALKLYKK